MNKNNNYRLSQVHNYFQRGHKAHSLTVFQPPFNYQFYFFYQNKELLITHPRLLSNFLSKEKKK